MEDLDNIPLPWDIDYSEPIKQETQPKELILPEKNDNAKRVVAYLVKTRCIAYPVVEHFLKTGQLYEDKEHHNAVFIGKDEETGEIKFACARGTINIPTVNLTGTRNARMDLQNYWADGFKMDLTGSVKQYGFRHIGTSDRLYVFEAPIDLMSYLTLHPQSWQKHSYVALSGAKISSAMDNVLQLHPEIKNVALCLDNDEAGIIGTQAHIKKLTEQGYTTKIIKPVLNDWNEDLQARSCPEMQQISLKIDEARQRINASQINEDITKRVCSPAGEEAFAADCIKEMVRLRADLKAFPGGTEKLIDAACEKLKAEAMRRHQEKSKGREDWRESWKGFCKLAKASEGTSAEKTKMLRTLTDVASGYFIFTQNRPAAVISKGR